MIDVTQSAPSSPDSPSRISFVSPTPFSREIHKAFDFVAFEFRRHTRKDPDKTIPVISHLAGVAYLLARYGFPEQVVVAGILHDYLEDVVQTPFGERRACRRRLETEFGPEVVHLVEFVTQKKYGPGGRKRSWTERNRDYIEALSRPEAPEGSLAISCADKIHNIRSIIYALERNRTRQDRVWSRLKKDPRAQLENFEAHCSLMTNRLKHQIVEELRNQLARLKLWVHT